MAKKSIISVKDVNIRTMTVNGIDYICITDIARQKNETEPKDVVKNWMRQKNTLEYLGLWERLHNPHFKGVEFDPLLAEAGSNAFTTINELICLSNMENVFGKRVQSQTYLSFAERRKGRTKFNINAVLINDGVPQGERLVKLNQIAIQQMQVLEDNGNRKLLK